METTKMGCCIALARGLAGLKASRALVPGPSGALGPASTTYVKHSW